VEKSRLTQYLRRLSLGAASLIVTVLAFTNDVVVSWFRSVPAGPVQHFDVALQPLSDGVLRSFNGIPEPAVKVDLLLRNASEPQAELHNVTGQVWAKTDYLSATFKQHGVLYSERRERGQVEFDLRFPVLSKMSHSWLPSWIFRLPPPGGSAEFGAQIVSAETNYRQYRWRLVNRGGKPVIEGGDATPKQLVDR
jgi:hypothetical protein